MTLAIIQIGSRRAVLICVTSPTATGTGARHARRTQKTVQPVTWVFGAPRMRELSSWEIPHNSFIFTNTTN